MRYRCCLGLLALGLISTTGRSLGLGNSLEQQVKNAEQRLWKAYSAHDAGTLQNLLADDLTFTKENGYLGGKASEIRVIEANFQRWRAESPLAGHYEVNRIRLYGATAVTTGSLQQRAKDGHICTFRFTNTWVNKNKTWQVVAIQITQLSPCVLRRLAEPAKPEK